MTSPNPILKHSPFTRWLGACCLLLAVACGADRFRDFVPEEIQPPPEARLQAYADTSLTMPRLRALRTDRQRLDSLIYYAEWLKNYDENAAYAYAEAAYNLATDRNWKFPRAIAAYRLAVLKVRNRRFGEDLEDALIDINISRSIIDLQGDDIWKTRVNSFLGSLFFWLKQPDSARYYLTSSLESLSGLDLVDSLKMKWKGMIMHDLGITYGLHDERYNEYLKQSLQIYKDVNMFEAQAKLQLDLGKYYQERKIYQKADSLYKLSLDYAKHHNNLELKASALRTLGYSCARQYSEDYDPKNFTVAKQLFQEFLQIWSEDDFLIYQNLGYLHHLRASDTKDYQADIDSTLYYYDLTMKSAVEAGATDVVRSTSDLIAYLCPELESYEGCTKLLGLSAVEYIHRSFETAFDSRRRESKLAYARTNRVEQREIIASAVRTRRDLILGSIAVLIMFILSFFILYQQQQKRKLEARMEALRAQINPHFMSNSLNAIENLINQDKKQEAAKYLIHFSRLSRQILQRSRSPNVSLKEELRTLKHFLELEKLRFQDKLNYEIVVDDKLNTELVEVPALLLQPYVENAIWHGIKPKAEPSHLRIELRREDKYLLGIVEDDGIGRERSRELKAQSVLQQKSMGMEITEERIQGMGKVKGTQVEVIDLRNDSGEPAGTRVQIRLPLRYVK